MNLPSTFTRLFLGLAGCMAGILTAAPFTVNLSSNGIALLRVVHSSGASAAVKGHAQDLADYLGRISGGTFSVTTGNGQTGIAVGTAADFPGLGYGTQLLSSVISKREDYILKSHASGLHVIGATDGAVSHAVWDLLYKLEYRQFFPGNNWEVVPSNPDLSIAVDTLEHPDYSQRRIWYGFGLWGYNNDTYDNWVKRNRLGNALSIATGHNYSNIISQNQAEFDAHPEYLCEPTGKKLNITDPGLRSLVVDWAVGYFNKNPAAECISMEPSDGGGWGTVNQAVYGSITNAIVTLANEVAEAVNRVHNDKYVGIYAYNYHAPPPDCTVHPKVIVSVASAYIKGAYTIDELLAGWQAKGAHLGFRDYFSVWQWDRDLPGKARAGTIEYLTNTIYHYYQKNVSYYNAESSDNWGPCGLGYYLASRLLWETDDAPWAILIIENFLEKCFGPAKEPMREFYNLIDGSRNPFLSGELLGQMYRKLDAAFKLANTAAVKARINDLTLYTRYVELFRDYDLAAGAQRQANFESLIRFSYRMRTSEMVHSKAVYERLDAMDNDVAIPAGAGMNDPEPGNPWKDSTPYAQSEITGYIMAGTSRFPLIGFQPVTYSTDLVPAAPLNLPAVPQGNEPLYIRSAGVGQKEQFYTWVSDAAQTVDLTIKAGLSNKGRGFARIELHEVGANDKLVDQKEVPDNKVETPISLKAEKTGLHKIIQVDFGDNTTVKWGAGTPVVMKIGQDERVSHQSSLNMYFYVPEGTKTVGGYAYAKGEILNADGVSVRTFTKDTQEYFDIPVQPGQDGKLWKMKNMYSEIILMTVPPYLARSVEELLIPAEVVNYTKINRGYPITPDKYKPDAISIMTITGERACRDLMHPGIYIYYYIKEGRVCLEKKLVIK